VPVRVPRQIPDPGWIDENMNGVQGDLEIKPTATVLVVDDEPAIREIVATLLEDEGYLVRHAKDGLEALATIDDNSIDLVVSDVVMPGLDGASLVRKLRHRGHLMPVVLMSAVYADVDLPGVRFVPKPFEIDRLLGTVASALRLP
jgi:two-component system OmpR family response regulator